MHICYFSKRCRFCQAFFEELSATPYAREIRFLCVDPAPGRPPLPAWLKSVPTLVVEGEEAPRVGPAAVNNWLFERKLLAGGSHTSPTQMQSPPARTMASMPAPQQSNKLPEPISSNTPASSKDGPPVLPGSQMAGIEAWHGAEMSGSAWSDEYSFLDDAFSSEKGYNPIIRNWESLAGPTTGKGFGGGSVGSAGAAGGLGAAGFSSGPQKSAKEEKLLKEFEQFSKMRDIEFAPIKRM